jgi:predicted enzyme related to lactoylglutathione lyase
MSSIRAIEVRLEVADVLRAANFYAAALDSEVGALWPQHSPEFAILGRDSLRLQLGKSDTSHAQPRASCTLWLDVEDISDLHSKIKERSTVEWGPGVYSYGRREFGFRDPDGNLVILSEATQDPSTCQEH